MFMPINSKLIFFLNPLFTGTIFLVAVQGKIEKQRKDVDAVKFREITLYWIGMAEVIARPIAPLIFEFDYFNWMIFSKSVSQSQT